MRKASTQHELLGNIDFVAEELEKVTLCQESGWSQAVVVGGYLYDGFGGYVTPLQFRYKQEFSIRVKCGSMKMNLDLDPVSVEHADEIKSASTYTFSMTRDELEQYCQGTAELRTHLTVCFKDPKLPVQQEGPYQGITLFPDINKHKRLQQSFCNNIQFVASEQQDRIVHRAGFKEHSTNTIVIFNEWESSDESDFRIPRRYRSDPKLATHLKIDNLTAHTKESCDHTRRLINSDETLSEAQRAEKLAAVERVEDSDILWEVKMEAELRCPDHSQLINIKKDIEAKIKEEEKPCWRTLSIGSGSEGMSRSLTVGSAATTKTAGCYASAREGRHSTTEYTGLLSKESLAKNLCIFKLVVEPPPSGADRDVKLKT